MRFLAVWSGGGAPPRTLIQRVEIQSAVRLVGKHPKGYLLEGDLEKVQALMGGAPGFKLEPCYPEGT
jgi:hypothetical protein